jgi:hypothetical protein
MAQRLVGRKGAWVAAAFMACAAMPTQGALPIVAGLGKQLVKDMLIDGVKSLLVGSLANTGCKGAAIASLLSGNPARTIGATLGAGSLAGAAPGLVPGAMDMSQLTSSMQQQMRSAMPAMSAEQMAQMNSAMVGIQQAMAQPLSPAETQGVFDELGSLGVISPAMQAEMRDCMLLAGPAAAQGMGMSAAMMKNMVLPQLREARAQFANLSPDERERLATEIAQAIKEAPPEDRKAFQDGFGAGFFPPDVVEAVKAKLR